MELIWPETDAWVSLQSALTPIIITHTQSTFSELGAVTITPGAAGSGLTLTNHGMRLGADLLGPGVHAAADQDWLSRAGPLLAPLALDRWRRSAGLLLEGLLLHQLARQLDRAPASLPLDWRTLGWAAEQVDRLDERLGWLWQPAADLLTSPQRSLHEAPRRAAWLLRFLQATGQEQSRETLLDWTIQRSDWASFGGWCRDLAHGPAAACPIPLTPAAAAPLPDAVAAMSHHPVRVQAPATGLRLTSPDLPGPVALKGDAQVVVSLGALGDRPPTMAQLPSAAVGTWLIRSGEFEQRVGAARGIELVMEADGRVSFTLANAFMGLVSGDMLSLADRFGASGFGGGRWSVTALSDTDGHGTLAFSDMSIDHLTIHPRKGLKFALPGQGWQERFNDALNRLNQRPVQFSMHGGEMTLSTIIRNAELMLRLERVPSEEKGD